MSRPAIVILVGYFALMTLGTIVAVQWKGRGK